MQSAFIIDDNCDTCEMLELSLGMYGYKAERFTSFELGWKRILNYEPCLIFMDWHIPCSMTPLDFVDLVRGKYPGLEICILSGDHRVKERASQLGTDFILKPFELKDVHEICAEYCN